MGVLLWVPFMVPLVVAALVVVPLPAAEVAARWAALVSALVVLGSGVLLVAATQIDRTSTSAGGLLRADSLSAFMVVVVGSVGVTATWGGLEPAGRQASRSQAVLVSLFLGAMSLALLADNLGVMWVAVEATTIATAFLVGHHRTRRSLEADWKYVVLGSVGVAIAFLGIVLLYAATRQAGSPTLSWVSLVTGDRAMDPALVRLAVALAVLGFATKAGLAPMHSWLPDAHSQAPAPVSALMSGVLLAVAFYAILRVQAVADVVLGPAMLRAMLAVGGLLSLAVAALLVLRQRDYKRLLAFSSIEHMGIVALGAAVGGPVATAAVLLHILGHGLAKAVLFVLSGRVLATEGTTTIADVRGLLARRPGLAVPWLAAMAALLGFPPFSLFFSEVAIFVAGWQAGLGWVMGAGLVLLLAVFGGLARITVSMALGPADGPAQGRALVDRRPHGPRAPLVLALAATAVVGFLAVPVGEVIRDAVLALGGNA
jgi:hydrogenase-4 component F